MSYLIQVRGLKHIFELVQVYHVVSYLIQVRGLKRQCLSLWFLLPPVVPYIGTWIETLIGFGKRPGHFVVPYIGTWIETNIWKKAKLEDIVVPYIGTWIETRKYRYGSIAVLSYLIQVRGLKPTLVRASVIMQKSYLIQVRGLKPVLPCNELSRLGVVPYIGTWIETAVLFYARLSVCVVPYIGTWIETLLQELKREHNVSYLIQVRGLKPNQNLKTTWEVVVVPYIGTWIETDAGTEGLQQSRVVPYIGTWIETRFCLHSLHA